MSSDTVNELRMRFSKIEKAVDESIQTPRLVLATRTDGTGSVEVLEEVDGRIQDPLAPEHTGSYKRFAWPKRTEFVDVTAECVEKSVWSNILQYQVSRARESEEAGQRIMQIWKDATEFAPTTVGMDEAEISAQVESLLNAHLEAFTAQRNAQERLESVRNLGFDFTRGLTVISLRCRHFDPRPWAAACSTSEKVADPAPPRSCIWTRCRDSTGCWGRS
jgi:hypothetical protein